MPCTPPATLLGGALGAHMHRAEGLGLGLRIRGLRGYRVERFERVWGAFFQVLAHDYGGGSASMATYLFRIG